MKKISFVIPYFGKFPSLFKIWLLTCAKNPTIDWLIFTDDRTPFNYPQNVKVTYCSFDEMRQRIQSNFDFKISLEKAYKLCDFRVAYGEIFKEELKDYDFWGYCDIDLLWGNIREFYTDDVLEKFEKIGFQGHSSLYKNTEKISSFYKTQVDGCPFYKEILSTPKNWLFDENIICKMYDLKDIKYFTDTVFAHLNRYSYGFFLKYLPPEYDYRNNRQIFILEDGNLTRLYLEGNEIRKENYMYIHFFSRPMTLKVENSCLDSRYIIIPDKIIEDNTIKIDAKFIEKYGKKGAISYCIRCLKQHYKKITLKKLLSAIKNQIKHHR